MIIIINIFYYQIFTIQISFDSSLIILNIVKSIKVRFYGLKYKYVLIQNTYIYILLCAIFNYKSKHTKTKTR